MAESLIGVFLLKIKLNKVEDGKKISITERRQEQVFKQLLTAFDYLSEPIITKYSDIKLNTGLSEVLIKILRDEGFIIYARLPNQEGKHCAWIGDKPTWDLARIIIEIARMNDNEDNRQRDLLLEMLYPKKEEDTEPVAGEEHEGMIGDRKVIIRYL